MRLSASVDEAAVAERIRALPSASVPAVLAVLAIPAAYAYVKNIADTGSTNVPATPEVLDAVSRAIDYVQAQEWTQQTARDMAQGLSFSVLGEGGALPLQQMKRGEAETWFDRLESLANEMIAQEHDRRGRQSEDPGSEPPDDWREAVATACRSLIYSGRTIVSRLADFINNHEGKLSRRGEYFVTSLGTRIGDTLRSVDAILHADGPYSRDVVQQVKTLLDEAATWVLRIQGFRPIASFPGDRAIGHWARTDVLDSLRKALGQGFQALRGIH